MSLSQLEPLRLLLPDGSPMPDAEVWFYPQLFSQPESDRLLAELIAQVAWRQDQIRLYGKTMNLPRLTAFYGDEGKSYRYSNITMQPQAWISPLLEVKNRVEAQTEQPFSSVLINRYRDGKDSMAWHSDDEPELGANPVIASVSFGAVRRFRFRHILDKNLKTEIQLTHGSLLLMGGSTQHFWQHEIPKTSKILPERLNLTFRVIFG